MIFVPHLLVYIHAQGVSLACQRRGKFRFVGEFDADESGYQAFAAALKPFKNARLSILVDSVDEQYHVENLPHVLGTARTEMLARRLRQISRDSAFAAAWHQGRDPDGRRDDRFLFVSLNTLDWAQVWLDLLARQHVHLALLTTVPIVSQSMVRHLPQESAPLLWVTQQSGGTRLSFFQQNRLLFSRLSTPESGQAAEKLAEEIIKTRYYLTSHQYLAHQSHLAVVVLDTQQDHQRLCEMLNQDTGLNLSCQVHVSDVLAQRLWINANDLHKYRDSLHLAALGRYSAAINLATPAMTLTYRQRWWQRGLYLTAAASLLVGVIAGGYLTYQRDQFAASAMQTHGWLKQQQNSYQHILAKMPATPTSPANLKAAVDVARTLSAAPQPVTDFAILSEVLTRDSHITVTRLVWQERNVEEPGNAQRVLVIEGEALLSQGNYPLAMAAIDRFVADLRQHPRIARVEVMSMPVNRDPKLTLHQSAQAVASAAAFKLKLLLRAPS